MYAAAIAGNLKWIDASSKHHEVLDSANDNISDQGTRSSKTSNRSRQSATTRAAGQHADQIWTLLTGIPNRSTPLWTAATVAVNAILTLFTLDVVYRAPYAYPSNELSFARVGYVSDRAAGILVREPDIAQLPLYISYRAVRHVQDSALVVDEAWKSAGKVYWLSNETDFTHTLSIPDLKASTLYQYAVSNNHSGSFMYVSSEP